MSLSPAQKDISGKPASGSIVDPVNRDAKDADINRKIQLYGFVQAFRQGRMPDNKQIDDILKYVIDNSPVDTSQLSPDGQKLIQDSRDILETARVIVSEKNADELFQSFIWHTRDVELGNAIKDPSEVLHVDQQKAKDDGHIAAQHLRTILSLVLTNSEVRKLFSDLSIIGRDLLAHAAVKVAENVRPDPESLARADDPAPQDQFVTEDGRLTGLHETSVPEARISGTNKNLSQRPKDDLGIGSKLTNGEDQTSGNEAYRKARNQIDQVANKGASGSQNGSSDNEVKKQGFIDKVRGLKDKLPQEHKDKVQDHVERSKRFLTEKYFPEERRDQFIFRCQKVVIECQKHDDYQESFRWLLGYIEEYVGYGKVVLREGKESQEQVTSDPALRRTTKELRTLLERFANNQSIDPIIDALNVLIDDSKRDPELHAWFKDVNAYIRKVLLEPGYVIEPDCGARGNVIRESGRKFYDITYRDHFDTIFTTIGDWFKAMGDDSLNERFGEDWARLTKDLLFDSEGSLKFKANLWNDIRKVILPTLVDKVGYIPIPRVEYTDESLDLVVENLTLTGRNLFPNYVSLEAHNFVKFSPYNVIHDEHHHEFTLTFGQMQADMKDVAFYFRKKTGIPKMADSGLADVLVGGEGLTATVHLVSADKDKSSVFKVKHVIVKVDTLKFSIRDSKHDLLYKTIRPLATGLVKKQIQKAIAGAITTGMEYVDGQLVAVRDRMEDAKETEGTTKMQMLQDLFKRKVSDSHVARPSERGSQFKVVSNKRDSLLATAGHPAGWVNRTAEKDAVALKGQDWRSDAFNIV